jgi:glycosyltransferase involved in cell wall biosynthesis
MSTTTEVLLCTYNGARFIVEQLQSILKQTTRVNKISIYDDQSSDHTVSLIRQFVAGLPSKDQRLFTITVNPRNVGYAENYMNAISQSTEDVLFLSDQDDIWEPTKAEISLSLFHQHNPDMVFSDGLLIDKTGQEVNPMTVLRSYGLSKQEILQFRQRAFEMLLKRNYINGAASAVRRIAAQSALPLPCDMPHDYWLAIWCALHGGIVATPQKLYRYRLHDSNAIGIGTGKFLYQMLGIWRHAGAPRERDLRIWKAVTERIGGLSCEKQAEAARRKLDWLIRVTGDKNSFWRGFEILRSAVNGSYRRYSGQQSMLRDIVSLIR